MADLSTKEPVEEKMRPTVITLRPGPSSSLKEITLIGPPRAGAQPRQVTLLANNYSNFLKPRKEPQPYAHPDSAVLINSRKIPRPPNAFMIFANEWRKQLAQQNPNDSNKAISVRLGHLWKNMSKVSKEVYYQRSRQAGQDHKQKYPGYVYNPKEARMRKALREQSRGARCASGAPTRWTKHPLTMNHQSLLSPVLLSQHQLCVDNSKAMLHEQVDRDNTMLQSYPDYLDLPYNIPSNDYSLDSQSWCSYLQPEAQSNGVYMGRTTENKLPVDWSTPYNSEQGNFIRASPQSSPYSIPNHQEVNTLLLNGDRSHTDHPAACESNCLVAEHKPVVDQITSQINDVTVVKDPEQQVKDLLASTKVISEGSPIINGKQEDSSSTRLPGFHQAFGSTEIGRFSQPDGFFEAAVAAENERKTPEISEFTAHLSFSPGSSAWTTCFLSYPESSKPEPDLFGFQDHEDPCDYTSSISQFNDPLYTMEDNFYNPDQQILIDQSILKVEPTGIDSKDFEPQDLSAVTSIGKPPVIISQNDNCCVVLESSAMDNDVKEYFSL